MAEKGVMYDLADVSLGANWTMSRGQREAIEFMLALNVKYRDRSGEPDPRREYLISYSNVQTFPAIQGENDQGGGYTMWCGTFTQNSTMRDTIRVTFHADKVNYPAFYSMMTDDPLVAVLAQVPATIEWSVNVGQFLMEAPQLPSSFDRQGKIFEQKFNLFNQWLQNTFLPQSELQIIYLQQEIINAPYVPGDLMDTGFITVSPYDLNQPQVQNFGEGGKLN